MERIPLLASLLPEGAAFAEIGSDHASISVTKLLKDPASRAFLSDNKEGPYRNSLRAIEENGLEGRAVAAKADGLDALPDWVNTLLLAGMGGRLIAEILERGKEKLGNIKTLVLEPQSDLPYLIGVLPGLGYRHVRFEIAEEGRHSYFCYVLEKGEEGPLGPLEALYGPLYASAGKSFVRFAERRLKALESILEREGLDEERRKALMLEFRQLTEAKSHADEEAS